MSGKMDANPFYHVVFRKSMLFLMDFFLVFQKRLLEFNLEFYVHDKKYCWKQKIWLPKRNSF